MNSLKSTGKHNKKRKKTNKICQDLKIETEMIKETKTEEMLEMKNLRIWTGTTEANFTYRMHETKKKMKGSQVLKTN